MFHPSFVFFPNPLPGAVFGGSGCPSILQNEFLNRCSIFEGGKTRPLERYFRPNVEWIVRGRTETLRSQFARRTEHYGVPEHYDVPDHYGVPQTLRRAKTITNKLQIYANYKNKYKLE